MFSIAKLSSPRDARIIRKFKFISAGRGGCMLDVMLEYAPPETLNEQMEKEQTRMVGARKYGAPEDLRETSKAINSYWHRILASRVKRIEGVTLRKLATLVAMDPSQLGATAASLDEETVFDPEDSSGDHR